MLPNITRFKKMWKPTPKAGGPVVHVRSTKTEEEKQAKFIYFLNLGIAKEYAYKWSGVKKPVLDSATA
jgi:hypothetical protein